MKQTWLSVATFAFVSSLAVSANAQAWLADRSYAEGAGIRTGNVEIHPGVGAEVGYDSNYFQRTDADEAGSFRLPVASAIRIRITPHLSLSTLGHRRLAGDVQGQPPDVTFRLDVSGSYNEFIPPNDDSEDVADQRHIAGGIAGEADIAPRRAWGGDLRAGYTRTVEPSNNPDTAIAFDRSTLQAGAGIRWTPGAGVFRNRLGYALRGILFEDDPFQGFNNLQHTIEADSRWRFLPRTTLLYRGRLTLLRFGPANATQNEGELVRSWLGINGLVTKHFGFLLLAGWGATFFDRQRTDIPPENFDSFIGQAEATWYLQPNQSPDLDAPPTGLSAVSVGYTRDFQNSYFGDYYQRDRVYAGFAYFAGGVFLLAAGGGYSRITRPNVYLPNRPAQEDVVPCNPSNCIPSKGENRVDASIFAEYRLSDSVGINTTFRYNANLTSTRIPGPQGTSGPNGGLDDLQFSRWEAYLGARWFL